MSADLVFLYDQILESAARFHCFVHAEFDEDDKDDVTNDIEHVAGLLARRDILIFSASVRNFGEATASIAEMKNYSVNLTEIYVSNGPPYLRDSRKSINLHRAISRVLHSKKIEILKSPSSYIFAAYWQDGERELLRRFITEKQNFPEEIDVSVKLKTERDGQSLFRLRNILGESNKYLSTIVAKLADKNIFLERSLRDA